MSTANPLAAEASGFYLGRLPSTDEELYWAVRVMFGVKIPRTQVCIDHVAPFTAFADAYFGRNSLDPTGQVDSIALWHGSRGLSGKSFMLSILGLTNAFLLGVDVNLLGGSLAQSANIHEHMRNALLHPDCPSYMVSDEGNTMIRLANRARIRPLTASQRTVRGPHPARLLLDEIDEMELKILDAALGQPMPQRNYLGAVVKPYTVMCSTWQNPQGTFTEIMRRTEDRGIPVYQWCMKESANPVDGWLSQETIEEKRSSTSAEMWRVEYELGEPSIGNRAFDTEAVDAAFSRTNLPLATKEAKDFEEYTYAEPVREGVYVATADWAKERDYTVISVGRIDVYPHELVYYLKVNRRPYPIMVGYFNAAMERYHASAEHDGTGLGNVINDYLNINARSFVMTGEKLARMLSEYVSAIEKGVWRFPKVKSAYLAHKYARVGDLYSSQKEYHLPDEVCAFALMQHMVSRTVRPANPIEVPRSDEPTKLERTFTTPPPRAGDVVSARESARERGGYDLTV